MSIGELGDLLTRVVSFTSLYVTQNTRTQGSKLPNFIRQTYTSNLPAAQGITSF